MSIFADLAPSSSTANLLATHPASGSVRAHSRQQGRKVRHSALSSPPMSATVLTKNNARLLPEVLAALAWCDEVIVFDTGSTDNTRELAASFPNVRVHQLEGPFTGFGRVRRLAVELARNDWIFSVDSDEVVSPELRDEIGALLLNAQTVYVVPFRNYFNGKHITTCGWAPDRHERIFNRTATNFCTSEVHERIQIETLSVVNLRGAMLHYSYGSIADFLRKTHAYSQLFADQHVGKKSSSPTKAVTRSAWAFIKSYFVERGFTQGLEGLVISAYKSQVVFWKYLMLHEANQKLRRAKIASVDSPLSLLHPVPAPSRG